MAKAKEGELTIAEATRLTWKELGSDASGIDVAKQVQGKYGHLVPSSTVSMAKKTVFGAKGRRVKRGSASAVIAVVTPVESKSTPQVVQELMASGLTSPTEIAAAAKQLGVIITTNYVSMIKSNAKKTAGNRKVIRRTADVSLASPAAAGSPTTPSDLELENAALKLALKAGSVQAAIAALGRLA